MSIDTDLSHRLVPIEEAIDEAVFAWGAWRSTCAHCSRQTERPRTDRDRVAFCSPACRRLYTRRIEYSHASGIAYSRPYRLDVPVVHLREAMELGYEGWVHPSTVLAEHCLVDPSTGCWHWLGSLQVSGYAQVRDPIRETRLMHRVAFAAHLGLTDLGPGVVHHRCAVRRCVNPAHLQLVDQASNVAEMLGRRGFLSAIEKLSDALRDLDPDHPALVEAASMMAT